MFAVMAFTWTCFLLDGEPTKVAVLGYSFKATFNTLGYAAGCLLSVVATYVFLRADRKARSTLQFNDWPGGVRVWVVWMTCLTWIAGAWHLWFWMLETTRP